MVNESSFDITVTVAIEAQDPQPFDRLRAAVTWVLRRHAVSVDTALSIVIMGDDDVRRLNREFREIDTPTDVLSFAAEPLPFTDDEPNLGDLILALPTIQRQAESEGHDWRDEMVLAVIHGTLHLLGYDHDTPENQSRMWQVQSEALVAMGVAIDVPSFTFDDEDEG